MKWWHSTCLERTGAWPFLPSKPKLDSRATAQGSLHLQGVILLTRNAFLVQFSHWLKHNILEDNRELGLVGGHTIPQCILETPFPYNIQYHKPLRRSSPRSHETCFLPLDLSVSKVSLGKMQWKDLQFYPNGSVRRGKRKNTLLLLFTSPSLPRGHPNRKPFRTLAWIKRFNIKINKNWISI